MIFQFAFYILMFLFPFFMKGEGDVSAQIIDNSPSDIFLSEPSFNKAFIKENKIKFIKANIVNKPDGKIIHDQGLFRMYEFDTDGNIIKYFYNVITATEKIETQVPPIYRRRRIIRKGYTKVDFQYKYDTLVTNFFYTSTGHLQMKRSMIGEFFNACYYEYYADGNIKKQTVCKETNSSIDKKEFRLSVQTILSQEKFEYVYQSPNQKRKKCLNDEGKIYKEGILNFAKGKLTDESYEFTVAWLRISTNYKYDNAGCLVEKIISDNTSGQREDKWIFEYDSAYVESAKNTTSLQQIDELFDKRDNERGNVVKEIFFRNGIQINEIIFLYDKIPSSAQDGKMVMMLTSQVTRQIQKQSITIVKYEYGFY
ncbi:MAG: hypothetical protein V1781_02485 [Bacteroidota bacterium]